MDEVLYELTTISNLAPRLDKIEEELAAIKTSNKGNYECVAKHTIFITSYMQEVEYNLKENSKKIEDLEHKLQATETKNKREQVLFDLYTTAKDLT